MKRALRSKTGRVVLVGAGPGDPELLTLRAARALGEADLVLYDALVDRRILSLAPKAQRFFVGKRAGRPAIEQRTIDALLVRNARRGLVVVRLKAGDPFVLGRGGEEAMACEASGISCEVVPGVSSAVAAPAAFGIPVTHREVSPGFLVLSAVPREHYEAVLSRLSPDSVTVVLMMALGARREIAAFLVDAAWPLTLPVALVLGGTTERGWCWRGVLGELGDAHIPAEKRDLPGLIVLGSVVSLADAISRSMGVADGESLEDATWAHTQVP